MKKNESGDLIMVPDLTLNDYFIQEEQITMVVFLQALNLF